MNRRGWLQLLGLAPVAASVLSLPAVPAVAAAPEPPKIILPPRPDEHPEFRNLDGFAERFAIYQDRCHVGPMPWDTVPGLREVRLDARLFAVETDWQELLGVMVPVRFSFQKRPEVYLWEGYLTELQHDILIDGTGATRLGFVGDAMPLILDPPNRALDKLTR